MQLKVRKSELLKCLAVGDSGEDVSHSDGSLGEGVGEVLLGEGTVTAVSSDEGSEGGGDLAVELAEVVLVEDEGFVSLIGFGGRCFAFGWFAWRRCWGSSSWGRNRHSRIVGRRIGGR